jgi:electron transfer flavoprotein alpha subunit
MSRHHQAAAFAPVSRFGSSVSLKMGTPDGKAVVAPPPKIVKTGKTLFDSIKGTGNHNTLAAAISAAKLDGVSKVRVADNAVYAHQLAEPMGALLAELADGYSHVLAAATTTGKERIAPPTTTSASVSPVSSIAS